MKAITYPFFLLADRVFPRYCVLCNARIAAAALFPLCVTCADSLPRLTGPACRRCGKTLVSEKETCMRCRLADYGFNRVTAIFPYADSVKALISAYKTHERFSLACFFAQELLAVIKQEYSDWVLVPVPPRAGKIRKKGWDQVDAIMKTLSLKHGIAVHKILRRVHGDIQQKSLNHDERARNIHGKFYCQTRLPLPRQIVLVDDVFTTGSTLSECAAVLKTAGALSVDGLCIAID